MTASSSTLFDWHDGTGWSDLATLRLRDFPREHIDVESSRTGEVKRFFYDRQLMEENEFYDGERSVYRAVDGTRVFINA